MRLCDIPCKILSVSVPKKELNIDRKETMGSASATILHRREMSCTLHWSYQWQESLSCALPKTCFLLLKYFIPLDILLQVICEEIGNDVWIDCKRHNVPCNHGSPRLWKDATFRIYCNNVAMFHHPEAPNPSIFFGFATSFASVTFAKGTTSWVVAFMYYHPWCAWQCITTPHTLWISCGLQK